MQSVSQRGIAGRTSTECKYLSWLIAILSLSTSKDQLRIRLPQHRQDCLYFYSQISAFFDQFSLQASDFPLEEFPLCSPCGYLPTQNQTQANPLRNTIEKINKTRKALLGLSLHREGTEWPRISHWLLPFSYKHESWAELFLWHTGHQSETPWE